MFSILEEAENENTTVAIRFLAAEIELRLASVNRKRFNIRYQVAHRMWVGFGEPGSHAELSRGNAEISFLDFILQEGRLERLLNEAICSICYSYLVQIVVHSFFFF